MNEPVRTYLQELKDSIDAAEIVATAQQSQIDDLIDQKTIGNAGTVHVQEIQLDGSGTNTTIAVPPGLAGAVGYVHAIGQTFSMTGAALGPLHVDTNAGSTLVTVTSSLGAADAGLWITVYTVYF